MDMLRGKIEVKLSAYPVCEYAFVSPKELPFREEVRYICRTECPRYGTSWSCPPAVGTVEECRQDFCGEMQVLSTESCAICEKCAYPDAPCRHPDRMFPCIESYGILVTELAEKNGITFMSGSGLVTWFSLILYNRKF